MFEEGIKLKQIHGEFNVYDYTLGNPYVDPPKAFFDALETVVHERKRLAHGYMQNSGFPETRQRVADELSKDTGRKYGIDNIIMTVGAAGAMNVAFKSILEPGDEVVVVAPYFPEYNFYINNHQGVRVTSLAKDDFYQTLQTSIVKLAQKPRPSLSTPHAIQAAYSSQKTFCSNLQPYSNAKTPNMAKSFT